MKKLIFTLIIICLFIAPVKAYELALTGSDTIEKNIDLTIDLKDLKTYDSFYGLTAKLNYNTEKLELLDISTDIKDFNLSYSAKSNKIVLYSPTGTKELIPIIKLKFKNIGLTKDEEGEVSITGINATDSNTDIKVDDIAKKIKATTVGTVSHNNLDVVKINGQSLELNDGELNYEIVVSNDTKEIEIKATSDNKKATVIGAGNYELSEGANEIKITVKDGDDEKTYTINVNREDSNSKIDEADLFIKSKKFKWNNLYFIPIGIIIVAGIILIIKRKGIK